MKYRYSANLRRNRKSLKFLPEFAGICSYLPDKPVTGSSLNRKFRGIIRA